MSRRGTDLNPANRFQPISISVDDYCDPEEAAESRALKTEWFWDETQSIVVENNSPDIPFRYSLNPYRGCEHGCAYCYARPYHEYLGWNAGTDFESKILVKADASQLLRRWLSRSQWSGSEHLMMSGVTDPYQPIEKKLRVTRSLIEVCAEAQQALSIITKNALITRDIDVLGKLAIHQATNVTISMTTLDKSLAMVLEPRCSVPEARLRAIRELSEAGIPVHVNVAPIIPGLNDFECAAMLEAIAEHARSATWILLRLPGSVEPIFSDWLQRHRPDAQKMILNRLSQLRGGQLNDSRFKYRMRGEGFYIDEFASFFSLILKKLGLGTRPLQLNTSAFAKPAGASGQMYLF